MTYFAQPHKGVLLFSPFAIVSWFSLLLFSLFHALYRGWSYIHKLAVPTVSGISHDDRTNFLGRNSPAYI